MAVDLELAPKQKRPVGEPCCEPVVYPDVERQEAERMAAIAKALADPVRLQLVDVLRKHAGKVCVCELVPLFDLSQPTVSHHLKVLRQAGIVDSERQGLWAYYYVDTRRTGGAEPWLSPNLMQTASCGSRYGRRYAEAAYRRRDGCGSGCGCGDQAILSDDEREVFGAQLYDRSRARRCPKPPLQASLGCGNPTAVADLHEGETVLDLGSGGRRRRAALGPACRAERQAPIGLDMTDEMLDLARANAAAGGRGERRVPQGRRSRTSRSRTPRSTSSSPTASSTSPATRRACCARPPASCGPGGRFAVSDVVADEDMDEATRRDMAAVDRLHRRRAHPAASSSRAWRPRGFEEIEIEETHRVHAAAASAIVRAVKRQAI